MIEPHVADENVASAFARAKALVEIGDFNAAAPIYFQLLDSELALPLRAEALTNLGATLCMQARGQPESLAESMLEQARHLLVEALAIRRRAEAPAAWATTRANLALVHLALYQASGKSDELLAAHLTLDGIEQVLRTAGEPALLDWIMAIRDQLLELSERRGRKR